MNRKDFLSNLSLGAAFALTAGCFGGCSNDTALIASTSTRVDFEVDLLSTGNAALLKNGGYAILNKVILAKDNIGNYLAATQRCTHEGLYKVILSNNQWYCIEHGAQFSLSGAAVNANASKGLTVFKTKLKGTMLRVYS
jgi:nitrite reductase/ring-hydroxylating ferredoxin subunit